MKSNSIESIINDKKKFNFITKSSFDLVDIDKSGYIDTKELKTVLTQIANDINTQPPSEEELNAILNYLDTDNNGTIEYNEFGILMKDILEILLEADY